MRGDRRRRWRFLWLSRFLSALLLVSASAGGEAAAQNAPRGELVRMALLSRHGVRAPTQTAEALNSWRQQQPPTPPVPPWPDFGVPPGYLTPKGEKLVGEIGSDLRKYLNRERVFDPAHCPEGVLIRGDRDERTVMTAQGLGSGLTASPDPARHCQFAIYQSPETIDPLFHPSEAMPASCPLLTKDVAKAVGDLNPPPARFGARLADEQSILRCCSPQLCNSAPCGEPPVSPSSCALPALPSCADAAKDQASIKGGLGIAQSFGEILLLQYTQGFDGDKFAFGRANDGDGRPDKARMLADLQLHTWVFDLVQRARDVAVREGDVAARQGANLLSHIAQALENGRDPGAPGGPDKLIAYVGHDTNIANVAALLGLHWQVSEYPPDDVPPGSGLIFELRRMPDQSLRVYAFFAAQSPDAMRSGTGETERVPVKTRRCRADGGPCEMADFVVPLAKFIDMATPILKQNQGCLKGQESELAERLASLDGVVVLVAWEHEAIVEKLLPTTAHGQNLPGMPTHRDGKRFDVVLRFDRAEPGAPWLFRQLFPRLLAGDSDTPLE